METLKGMFWKPTPADQLRKCNGLVRSNSRQLDRDMHHLRILENQAKQSILATSKRQTSTPAETRLLARELVRIRRQRTRLATSKAQLESVGMQVKEAFSVRKIEGSIKASTGVMKDVNRLIRLPELTGTMRELSTELMKAGIIDEMVGDMLPGGVEEEMEEEAEAEVDKVLSDLIGGRLEKTGEVPTANLPQEEEEQEVDPEQLEIMKERLLALRS